MKKFVCHLKLTKLHTVKLANLKRLPNRTEPNFLKKNTKIIKKFGKVREKYGSP